MPVRQLPESWRIACKGNDPDSFRISVLNNLEYRLAKDHYSSTEYDRFLATAYAVNERLIERWMVTQQFYHNTRPKCVYYFSMEYLMGRSLGNSLLNLGIVDSCTTALEDMGQELEDIRVQEVDAGLGNGGLGRLAACFLDSMATLGIPAYGYGIRFDYGLFHQKIVDFKQVEFPDNWLALPNPWEIARPEMKHRIFFGGNTENRVEHDGKARTNWVNANEVLAVAYDTPVPGYDNYTVNTLRLWTAHSPEEFNFDEFNQGDYLEACTDQVMSENITKVLYPNDNVSMGRELRLKQEYFLVSASLQDIIRRFKVEFGDNIIELSNAIAIQLNDTHPSLAIPELIRLLVDEEGLEFETAWEMCVRIFGYTNHTLMPEALEEWPVELLSRLLPRHMEIIYLINHYFLKEVSQCYPTDVERLQRMSLIAEDGVKRVRMGYLAVVGSHAVNGVAELHSKLMRETIFCDFAEMWPEKFQNKTNGVTPRRWMRKANPGMSALINEAIGDKWVKNLEELKRLEPFADDAEFRARWAKMQLECKAPIIEQIAKEQGVILTPESLFDVQVKRMHEYKRQLLFALYIIATYVRIKENPELPIVPRSCLIGGKAAPGYYMAKLIIQFINHVADMINRDPQVNDKLKVVFLPNYRVSLAEKLIPAADLSEQISTAGKEASGTGNMKFALNGAITIGTLDGANIEILEEVGAENIFIFGNTAAEISALWCDGYNPQTYIDSSPLLTKVIDMLKCDFFSPGQAGLFQPILDELCHHDGFNVCADFDAYVVAQDAVSVAFTDVDRWNRMSILNVARCSKFSSDRTINEYARDIWGVKGVEVPDMNKSGNTCPK